MDDILQSTINRFRAYLEGRQFSAQTVVSYTTDLRLFFAKVTVHLASVSFREADQFVDTQHQHSRSWATINRRLNALKHFFDYCLDQQRFPLSSRRPSMSHVIGEHSPLVDHPFSSGGEVERSKNVWMSCCQQPLVTMET